MILIIIKFKNQIKNQKNQIKQYFWTKENSQKEFKIKISKLKPIMKLKS